MDLIPHEQLINLRLAWNCKQTGVTVGVWLRCFIIENILDDVPDLEIIIHGEYCYSINGVSDTKTIPITLQKVLDRNKAKYLSEFTKTEVLMDMALTDFDFIKDFPIKYEQYKDIKGDEERNIND
jgi:hypothetical protein